MGKRAVISMSVLMMLVMLACILTGCGEPSVPDGEKTLWGKSVDYEIVSVPENAIRENTKCWAVSPDGNRFFMSANYGTAPYLWDVNSGKIITVKPANDITDIMIRQMFWNYSLRNLRSEEQKESLKKSFADIDTLSGEALLKRVYSFGNPPFLRTATRTVPVSGNAIVITDSGNTSTFALDTETGYLYAAPEGYCFGVCDEKMYCKRDSRVIVAFDMKTGEKLSETDLEFAGEFLYSQNEYVFSDGTVFAFMVGFDSEKSCRTSVLAIIRPDGTEKAISLGSWGRVPNELYSADGVWIALKTTLASDPVVLVNTETDEVTVIGIKDNKLVGTSLEECVGEDGIVDLSLMEAESIILMTGLGDGQTIAGTTLDGVPILIRPDTMEMQRLLNDENAAIGVIGSVLSGNGYDRWLIMNMNMVNVWIRLKVR